MVPILRLKRVQSVPLVLVYPGAILKVLMQYHNNADFWLAICVPV